MSMEGIDWCDDLQPIPSCPIQLLPARLRVGMSTAQVDVHGRKVVGTPAPALNPGFRPIATQTPFTDRLPTHPMDRIIGICLTSMRFPPRINACLENQAARGL
jgi:hypothetical protein